MKDIDQVIDEALPTLEQLERDRLQFLQKKSTCIWAVIFPGVAVTGMVAISFFPIGLIALIGWGIISLVIYHFMAGAAGKAYIGTYKNTVIEKLVNLIDERLHYARDGGIDSSYFVGSELFSTRPDRYSTEDLIHGEYGKTNLRLGEIHAEEKRETTDGDGHTSTSYVTIFKGLFMIADFHKHFHGRTFVLPDFAEKTFGGFGRALQKMSGRRGTQLVQMEDPEFEQTFVVHSTDQIEARYILSPAMMRRLLDLKRKFGSDVRVAFKESSVWIAVPHKSPYLEPNTKISATNRQQIEGMMYDISSFIETVEELDLNTRIWTKE